jgi:hypothetical protein
MTKEDMKLYTNLNYRVQFGMNLKALYSKKMVELTGSEKQVKWAKDIRGKIIIRLENQLKNTDEDLRLNYLNRTDIETTIKNIKEIDSAKTLIDMRYDTLTEFINNYKDIEITEEAMDLVKESEKSYNRILNRLTKIKNGEAITKVVGGGETKIEKNSESYIEITQGMIHKKVWSLDESGRLAKMIYNKLMEEI